MKKIAATFFILGIPWLLIVVPVILSPMGLFMPEYKYNSHDVVSSFILSLCGLLGIIIWLGYRLRWKTNSFIWLTKRQFWTLSFIHHVAWIFIIPRSFLNINGHSYWNSMVDFWSDAGSIVYAIWIMLSIGVSIIGLIYDSDSEQKILAESGPGE
jgi:hypothetical protein